MPTISDLVNPAALTSFVREVPNPNLQVLNQILPDRTVSDIEAVIDEVTQTNRAAKFRTWDAETPIGRRDQLTRRRVKLPPIGQKTLVGEEETLQLQALRTGGQVDGALIDAIYDDAAVNTRAIRARMELARGDVLTDGTFTLTGENGLTLEADWGVPGGNIVSAAIPWSTHATATPLTDIRTWSDAYTTLNGAPPATAWTSRQAMTDLMQCAQMTNRFANSIGGTDLISEEQLQAVLRGYGLPAIRSYDTLIDVDGVSTRVTPADRFIMVPQDVTDLGYTAWGITAEALALAGGQNPSLTFADAPGLVGVVMRDGDPVRTWTKVTGVGMPILVNPRLLMVADVL